MKDPIDMVKVDGMFVAEADPECEARPAWAAKVHEPDPAMTPAVVQHFAALMDGSFIPGNDGSLIVCHGDHHVRIEDPSDDVELAAKAAELTAKVQR